MSVLFAILAICKAMLTCIEHQWGVIPGVLIALFLFGVLYGIFWFCFWFAEKADASKWYFEQEVEDNRDWHRSCEMPDGTTDLQEMEQKCPQYTSLRSYVKAIIR